MTAPITWRKSTFSGTQGDCVELATTGRTSIALRESDAPEVVIGTTPRALRALIRTARAGRYDRLR